MHSNTNYKLCKLYDAGGDLSKQWFVYFYILDPASGKFSRKREYVGTQLSAPERYAHLRALKDSIDRLLITGKISGKASVQSQIAAPKKLIEALAIAQGAIEHSLSERSSGTYRSMIRRFVRWLQAKGLDQIAAKDFTKAMAGQFLSDLRNAQGWKTNTYNHRKIVMQAVFARIVDLEIIEMDPFAQLKAQKATEPEIQIWTNDEQQALSEYLARESPGLYLAAALVYMVALRPSEIVQLKFKHFDHERNLINVPSALAKNRKGIPVTMPRKISELVAAHQANGSSELYLFGRDMKPATKSVLVSNVQRRFRKARKALGLPIELKMYSFKHKGNIDAHLNHNITLLQIRERNRHSSLQVTDKYMRRIAGKADPDLLDLDMDL